MSSSIVAVIPARGGSKGVPGKNLRRVGGVPLVVRAVRAARAVPRIGRVVVSTDDRAIAEAARQAGADVVDRPREIAGDTASSESALLHALAELDPTGDEIAILVFLQATSPFIDASDLAAAVDRVADGVEEVVFSAVESWGFVWTVDADGARGVNHAAAHRPRRQDRAVEYLETGAFYVIDAAGFRAARHRFFGRVGVAVVAERTAIEIDTEEQLALASAIAPLADPAEPIDVDALVTDFDGVHTDDSASVDQDGRESVRVRRSDGMGVALLRAAGVPTVILSTEQNPVVAARAAKLGIEARHGLADKASALRDWARERGVALDRVAYLGNDVNDVGCLESVGWPLVVADAHPAARAAARVVLEARGGHGAVREAADRILAARTRGAETDSLPPRKEPS